jgi:branched-chain amino acid transport system substrate-binding protein
MDDARGRVWDPVAVGQNARRAAQDSSAAAYIGELDSEPTRGSVPITNDAGIVQVSPGASAIDLTGPAEGYPDSPDRYRPSGSATFARMVPSDSVQTRALAEWAEQLKLTRFPGQSDGSPFGNLMLTEFTDDAAEGGVQVDPVPPGELILIGHPSFLAGGDLDGPGVLSDGRTEHLVAGPLDPENLPRGSFTTDFIGRYARSPGPYAAYGYEAMRVVLEAIKDVDGSDQFRTAVVDGVIGSEHPESVLGLYSITSEGDSTLCAVQRYERPSAGGRQVPGESVCPRP